MKLIFTSMRHSARVVIFQIIPHQFVGIQLWRIRRQVENLQSTLSFAHKFMHFPRAMHRVIVHNQKDRRGGVGKQTAEKLSNVRLRICTGQGVKKLHNALKLLDKTMKGRRDIFHKHPFIS
ncbi:MAG: hypothetical protein PHI97_33865, partial [Desulfobulbus sp.]|nr:hypothetical protein [Desulfobulbus sp.]